VPAIERLELVGVGLDVSAMSVAKQPVDVVADASQVCGGEKATTIHRLDRHLDPVFAFAFGDGDSVPTTVVVFKPLRMVTSNRPSNQARSEALPGAPRMPSTSASPRSHDSKSWTTTNLLR
jgi:hypothetical protein